MAKRRDRNEDADSVDVDDPEYDEPAPTKRKKRRAPKQRFYIHRRCGGEMGVRENAFWALADPFSFTLRTPCRHCGASCWLTEVYWKDTGETIADYRKRLREKAGPKMWLLRWGMCFVVGAALCIPSIIMLVGKGPGLSLFSIPSLAFVFALGAGLWYLFSVYVLGFDYRHER